VKPKPRQKGSRRTSETARKDLLATLIINNNPSLRSLDSIPFINEHLQHGHQASRGTYSPPTAQREQHPADATHLPRMCLNARSLSISHSASCAGSKSSNSCAGWLLVFVVAGLVGATMVHVVLQRGLELSQLLPFYIGWTLGVIIVWGVSRLFRLHALMCEPS